MFVVEQVTFPHLYSSMFQQGISEFSAWQWYVWIGCSLTFAKRSGEARPAGTWGHAALERAMKYSQDKILMN